jgi:single-stranded-DNA-specific exonuclease
MNYNLIKVIDKELTPIERVLTNRGIDLSEVEHYLDTTDDDIFSPDLLNNMREGAQMLIKNISNNIDTQICVDPDVDGFSSAALLINYLYKLFPAYVLMHLTYKLQEGKEHGIIPERISENIKFVIAPDSSSNSVIECAEMASRGADVLILDHHEVDTPATTACIINN